MVVLDVLYVLLISDILITIKPARENLKRKKISFRIHDFIDFVLNYRIFCIYACIKRTICISNQYHPRRYLRNTLGKIINGKRSRLGYTDGVENVMQGPPQINDVSL